MKIAYFGNTLNRHQAYVADALFELTKGDYVYVETVPPTKDNEAGGKAKLERSYVYCAYESEEAKEEALKIAREYDVVLFGAESFLYEKERMRTTGKLAFEVSERALKRGWLNLLSPRLRKRLWYYHTKQWKYKPLYKLCSSAYGAGDEYRLRMFRGRCYKWGYFTQVENVDINTLIECRDPVEASSDVSTKKIAHFIWCARFLSWKHPELVILLAKKLKDAGYIAKLELYGDGPERVNTETLSMQLGVSDIVQFHGNVDNDRVIHAMRQSDILLFTSDRREGWGAVLNEAMSNGCAVVASDAIGSVPFLVKDGVNGLMFRSGNLDSLYGKVTSLIEQPNLMKSLANNAYATMRDVWCPQNAASSLLLLIDDLLHSRDSSIVEGPCSKAYPL